MCFTIALLPRDSALEECRLAELCTRKCFAALPIGWNGDLSMATLDYVSPAYGTSNSFGRP